MSKTSSTGGGIGSWSAFITDSGTSLFGARIMDESVPAYISSFTSALPDGLHHLVMTKHDDSALASSIITYVDGKADRVDNIANTYVTQEAITDVVRIGAESDDSIPLGMPIVGGANGPIFQAIGAGAVWTPAQVSQLHEVQKDAFVEHTLYPRRWMR